MKFLSIATTTLALFTAGVTAAPAACPLPPTYNKAIATQICDRGRSRTVSKRLMLALFETAWVESHVNNLPCGTGDSLGVFRQSLSMGWCAAGPSSLCLDVIHATDAFIDEAVRVAKPAYTAGQLAQAVQRSSHPLRYDEAESTARSILADIGGF